MATTEAVGPCLLANVQQPLCAVASIKSDIENSSTLPLHTAQHYRQASRDIQAKQQAASCIRPLIAHSVDRVEETIGAPCMDQHVANNCHISLLVGRSISPCPRPAVSVPLARSGRRSATPTRDPPPPYHMALRYSNSRYQVRSAAFESSTHGSNASFTSETSSGASCVDSSVVDNSQDMSLWRHAVRRFGTNNTCFNGTASQLPQPRPPLPPSFKLRSSSDSQPDSASSPVSSSCTLQNTTADGVPLPVHHVQRAPLIPYTCISPLRQFNAIANESLNRSTQSTKSLSLNESVDAFQVVSLQSPAAAARSEVVEHEPPPRLGLSGVLGKSTGKVVLRPTVFKPVVNGGESSDSGFVDERGVVLSPALLRRPASAGAHLLNRDGSLDNKMSSSATTVDSSSGSGSAAAMLRQRENQLTALRCTMEQNERALLQVFEERRRDLERQLLMERQRAAKLEASVTASAQLARQAETTCAEIHHLLAERSHELQMALQELRQTQNSSEQHLARCNQLETSLKEASGALDDAASELRQLRQAGCAAQLSMCDTSTQTTGMQSPPTPPGSLTDAECISSVTDLQERLLLQEAQFEKVRAQWLDEKSKVVAYQKQLQTNYLQLCRKSQRLEAEVQRLTNDLERKEVLLKGAKSNSGDSFC